MNIIKGKAYYAMPEYRDIPDLFEKSVAKGPYQLAITYRNKPQDEPIHLTYEELAENLDALRLAWSKRGLTNQRMAIIGENSYYWIASYMAATKCQDFLIPIDNLLTPAEIISLLERSKADFLSIDARNLLKFKDDLTVFGHLKLLQIMKAESLNAKQQAELSSLLETMPNVEIVYFADLIREGREYGQNGGELRYSPINPEEPSILIFTSGTTAMSKGVLLSQKAIVSDVAALHGIIDFPDLLRSLSMLPLNHTFESTCGMLGVLSIGGHIHIFDGLRYVQKNLQEYKIQMFIGVPAIFDSFYSRIMNQIKKRKKERLVKFMLGFSNFLRKIGIDRRRKFFKDILSSIGNLEIAIIGAAPMKEKQIKFFDAIGVRVYEGYGLTETAPVAIANNDFTSIPGTIGEPMPNVEVKIDSNTADEPGELLIRGPILMHGYYENPAATKEAFTEDGWFRTGDLGLYDTKTKTFKITGRKKSMIVLDNGKKVFPEEIENLIKKQQVAIIKDSMVFAQEAENNQKILSIKFVLNKIDEKLPDEETVYQILDNLLQDINKKIPDFKRIKSYFYSYKDMISTSTLKVKREQEYKRLETLKRQLNLRWNQLDRKNIDLLEAQI